MFLKKTLCVAALTLAAFNAYAGVGPLSIKDGLFMKDGKPFYGVGVNYFDGFARNAKTGDSSYKKGLQVLAKNKIPFIRISALPFWPNDLNTVLNDPRLYHERLDAFLNEAEANHIGVIVDVFWNWTAIADVVGEKIPMTGVPGSKTLEKMKAITLDIVKQHQNHKAVWAWEFANEASSFMDLTEALGYTTATKNNNGNYLPSNLGAGAPARTAADDFTPQTIQVAVKTFAETVRTLDKTTPILSGNNVPRENAYHMRHAEKKNVFALDSREEFGKILEENDPAPVDTYSLHLYPNSEGKYFDKQPEHSTIAEIISAAMDRSKLVGSKRPFFLGEFGADGLSLGAAGAQEKFNTFKKEILRQRVQMSALWVYDFSYQNADYNVTETLRAYQLEELKQMNIEMSTW
ncbi:MAG: hypothetical protein V4495_27385 [Pseudomonadota bacterium]